MKKKVIALLGMVICLSMAACGGSSKETVSNGADTTTQDSNEKTSNEAETEKEVEVEKESETTEQNVTDETDNQDAAVYNINDSVQLKDWTISVTDFKIVDSIPDDYGEFTPREEGDKFAQIFVMVTNNGKQQECFLPKISNDADDVKDKLIYGDGYEFEDTWLTMYENELHDAYINPLSSKTGEIAFEIPDSVASSTDEIIIQFTSGNDNVQFKVR